jgi:signal transduction histidine kinase
MKHSWFPISLVAVLLILLGLLAGLQYNWLHKISDDERERMQKRLATDSQRFAEDFNREIQSAYFSFQLEAKVWRERNYASFAERYDVWRANTKFPALVKDVYFTRGDELLRFDAEQKTFTAAQWTDELNAKREEFAANKIQPVDEKNLLLAMPIYEALSRIMIRDEHLPIRRPAPPEKFGHLIIKLDADTIKNQIFPDLASEYFSDGANADFRLTVVNQSDASDVVFATEPKNEFAGQSADASVPLFNLSPDHLAFYVNRELLSTVRGERRREKSTVIANRTFERRAVSEERIFEPSSSEDRLNIFKIKRNENNSPRILQEPVEGETGKWLLNVQHADGSLESFITNARRKNMALSFGLLSLLAVSVVLIFVTAQRAKQFAQKQINFVSAVSHEFRTPLAVIYSAGENLTDGVVDSKQQIERYGNLIKGEGKKLSAMVEQILEFAGARSGKRKYDFRRAAVKDIIENALTECESVIEEKGFTVEREIAENLPFVAADEKALSQAIQNLVVNSVKYSNGNSWLKIAAYNGDGKIKVAVEDKGIGISAKDLKHVFEPFFRSKIVVDEQIHGNGLGLSLVKQTVEAHGGKITVESKIGKGSRFTIELKSVN